ncbi:hypothetical protein ABK040_004994 [Willaertia magna]
MLNNRERIGDTGINWLEAALGIGKNRRKTIGFGAYNKKTKEYEDSFYIRELSIINGGIGCALWDAAIILTRYIYEFGELIFSNKKVIELGAGVGLCGICASRFASECYITDVSHLVENLEYNLSINYNYDEEDDFMKCKDSKIKKYKDHMKSHGKVLELDWYKIYKEIPEALRKRELKEEEELKKQLSNELLENEEEKELKNDNNKKEKDEEILEVPSKDCDIIIGSELTYNGDHGLIEALMKVIDTFLSETGIFLEILSDDRDGVSYFVNEITKPERYGYICKSFKVHDRYMGNFGTNQRPETYKFYVLTRSSNANNELFLKMCETMSTKSDDSVSVQVDQKQ